MKSATLPSVRIEASLREEIERALDEGESLSTFVETSVRESLQRRRDQSEFIKRGLSSLKAAQKSGKYISAETTMGKLEERLAKAKSARAHKAASAG
ncbi:MAG: prevent-host-death protein [Cytophagales bacterium]|nr:prevent-host-death protein [Rhizobacter sp.]